MIAVLPRKFVVWLMNLTRIGRCLVIAVLFHLALLAALTSIKLVAFVPKMVASFDGTALPLPATAESGSEQSFQYDGPSLGCGAASAPAGMPSEYQPEVLTSHAAPAATDVGPVLGLLARASETSARPVMTPSAITVPVAGMSRVPVTPSVNPSVFGTTTAQGKELIGRLFDLKQDAQRRKRSWDYFTDLRELIASGVKPTKLLQYYSPPRKLYLSHLFVPPVRAEKGPEVFDVETTVRPTGWFIDYSGTIVAPETGEFRFVGAADDILLVFVDGRLVLDGCYPGERISGRKSAEFEGRHAGLQGNTLDYGEWLSLTKGREHRIDIVFGEHPGGWMHGVLLVQQRDRQYRTEPSGRPILPPFATRPLNDEELGRLRAATFAFELNEIPIW
jgi:hypothetical protein